MKTLLKLLLIIPQFMISQVESGDIRSIDDIFIEKEMMISPDTINISDPLWRYKVCSQGFGFGKSHDEAYKKAYNDALNKAKLCRYVAEYFDNRIEKTSKVSPNVMSTTFFNNLSGEWSHFVVIWMRLDDLDETSWR